MEWRTRTYNITNDKKKKENKKKKTLLMTANQQWCAQHKKTHIEQRSMIVTWRETTKKKYKEVRLTKTKTKWISSLVR